MGRVSHHCYFRCIPIDLTKLLKELVTKTELDSISTSRVITEIYNAKPVQEMALREGTGSWLHCWEGKSKFIT